MQEFRSTKNIDKYSLRGKNISLNKDTVHELYLQLMATYERCTKSKPQLKRSLFHLEYAQEVYRLASDIVQRRYRPSVSNVFVVFYPKPREIIAAHIRDRIVHHFIHEHMSPYWERRFSPHSYACRQGKGPLLAVRDLRSFVKGVKAHSSRPLYYLKVDIAAFFPSINLEILEALAMRKLNNPLMRYLVEVTLHHRPVDKGHFSLKSPREHWLKIPKHKSMFYAPRHKGLPIGNLTSQFFANLYLNELDQYITHRLKGRFLYWQRYVDDGLFLAHDRESLQELPALLDEFLLNRLDLRLNPTKTILQPLDRGIDHLGYWIKPSHVLVRQKNVRACQHRRTIDSENEPQMMQASLNSYFGLFRQADCKSLRSKIAIEMEEKKYCDGRIYMDPKLERVIVGRDLQQEADDAAEERKLVEEFRKGFLEPDVSRINGYVKGWKSMYPILRDAEHMLSAN